MTVERFISLKDEETVAPPEHLPPDIEASFREGAMCMAVGCYNAGATMFRLCLDHDTTSLYERKQSGLRTGKRIT
jgi:hypothetical protein